jgi:hypothetical protein
MVLRIEDAPEVCGNCHGTDLHWHVHKVNRSGVVDGRLRAHDLGVQFYLGCEGCSETLMTISDEEFMREANNSREANYAEVAAAISRFGITMVPGLVSYAAKAAIRTKCFKSIDGACRYFREALERADAVSRQQAKQSQDEQETSDG